MFGGDSDRLAGQQHNDILSVEPENAEQKAKLVDELKRRANAAFKTGSLREAEILYTRAIDLKPDDDTQSALYSNRSMTRSKMGNFSLAKEDAEAFLSLTDKIEGLSSVATATGTAAANKAKAHYRLAVAVRGMKDYSKAIEEFEKCLELEPSNKTTKDELMKTKDEQEKYAALLEIQNQERINEQVAEEKEMEIERENGAKVVKKIVEIDEKSEKATKKSSRKNKDGEDLSMRGYRVTKDGKKTTFFNMERTEEELRLISQQAESKPQKLDTDNIETSLAGKTDSKDASEGIIGASVWNQKGTFEETDLNSWAKTNLNDLILTKNKFKTFEKFDTTKSKKIELRIVEIKDLEGDASVTFTRGKKRKIFDFNFVLEIEAKCFNISDDVEVEENADENQSIKFQLFYPEFSGDVMNEFDVDDVEEASKALETELRWNNREKSGSFQELITNEVSNSSSGFRIKITAALLCWVHQFNKL